MVIRDIKADYDLSRESNVVYIGRKPMMSYVMAVITSFTESNAEEVTLKGRGRAITTVVDVAEITRRRFMKESDVGKIITGTEEILQKMEQETCQPLKSR